MRLTFVQFTMSALLEENLREAACVGDLEVVQNLVRQKVNVNCKNSINGWTPLHWACKRGHENIVKYLITNGADISVTNIKGETPANVSSNPTVLSMLGCHDASNINMSNNDQNFIPNYIKNAPLNGHIDIDSKYKREYPQSSMNHTANSISDNLILRIRVAGSDDSDYIEIEIPHKKLSYSSLLSTCCQELCVKEMQVERIRKLPNIRLRNDSDVKRLNDLQYLEIVLYSVKPEPRPLNPYPLITTCKNQTILY